MYLALSEDARVDLQENRDVHIGQALHYVETGEKPSNPIWQPAMSLPLNFNL